LIVDKANWTTFFLKKSDSFAADLPMEYNAAIDVDIRSQLRERDHEWKSSTISSQDYSISCPLWQSFLSLYVTLPESWYEMNESKDFKFISPYHPEFSTALLPWSEESMSSGVVVIGQSPWSSWALVINRIPVVWKISDGVGFRSRISDYVQLLLADSQFHPSFEPRNAQHRPENLKQKMTSLNLLARRGHLNER
jgi:hypothetical protein